MPTPYHAKYYAHELTRQAGIGEDVERLSASLFNASIKLTPHQVDAALFALGSHFEAGALLADEVGLGKTIEAGLAMCQYWAEGRRRMMVVCPASLRTQWQDELREKFNLPSIILDTPLWKRAQKAGEANPFFAKELIICSYHFAAGHEAELAAYAPDLMVMDEAHRLRNGYRKNHKLGQALLRSTKGVRKLLLTATPMQNSLLELYGLSQFVDEFLFGDLVDFRERFVNQGGDPEALKERLQGFCKRTLRRDVAGFVHYTDRKPLMESFTPSESEQRLYELVSEFLQREDTYAIPRRIRHLEVLGGRKRLASSTIAIVGTLRAMVTRLEAMQAGLPNEKALEDLILEELFGDEVLDADEIEEAENVEEATEQASPIDRAKLAAEISEIKAIIGLAESIHVDEKAKTLLKGLKIGFEETERLGAPRKALIFTESRRTQDYLKGFLEQHGYSGKITVFNGSNGSPEAKAAYQRWHDEQTAAKRPTTSRQIDLRKALRHEFRDRSEIMIATEAGAEGLNLQFCSFVINYDLPWNPQRIEQRIGRCHRMGQKHDVVVLNFLNNKNYADQRVFQLLDAKFQLFAGVFGASDEVLGALESGVDLEKRILSIFQTCRNEETIKAAFDQLEEDMREEIDAKMLATREKVFERLDEQVIERIADNFEKAKRIRDRVAQRFWALSKEIIGKRAAFNDSEQHFDLEDSPIGEAAPAGRYWLIGREDDEHESDLGTALYRLSHPLGEWAIVGAKKAQTPSREVIFNASAHQGKISAIEALIGQSGWLRLDRLGIKAKSFSESHLLFSGVNDQGKNLSAETLALFFNVMEAEVGYEVLPNESIATQLAGDAETAISAKLMTSDLEALKRMRERFDGIDRWRESKIEGLSRKIELKKAEERRALSEGRKAETLEEIAEWEAKKQKYRKEARRLRAERDRMEDEIQDEAEKVKDSLIERIKAKSEREEVFTLRWKVV